MSIVTNKPTRPAYELIAKANILSCFDRIIGVDYLSSDSLSFNLSQPLSVESGKATFKIPYYLNKSSNGFNEKEIDMSVKDRFNKLNLDYVYNFSDYSQLHTGITIGMINFNALDDSSFMINYKLSF